MVKFHQIKKSFIIQYLKLSSPVLIVTILVTLVPLYLIFQGTGPLRAWAPISLVLSFFFNFLFLIIGYQYYSKIIHFLFRVVLVASLLVIIAYIIRQNGYTRNYSQVYDSRYIYLEKLNSIGNKKTIDVKGFPDSGMLPNSDITEDENDPLNKDYQFVLGLSFKVKSSDNYFKTYTDSTNIVY